MSSRYSQNGITADSATMADSTHPQLDPPTSPHINHTVAQPPVKLSASRTKRSLTGTPLISRETTYHAHRSTYSSLQRMRLNQPRRPLQPPYSAGPRSVAVERPEIPVLDPDVDGDLSDDSSPIKRGSKVAGLQLLRVYHHPGDGEPPAKYIKVSLSASNPTSLPQVPPSTREADVTILPLASHLAPPTDYITPERWTEPVAKLPPVDQHVRITSHPDQDTTSPLKTKTEAHSGNNGSVPQELLSPTNWDEDLEQIRHEYRQLADNLYRQLDTKHDRITILETEQKRHESELLRARQRSLELEVELKSTRHQLQQAQQQRDHHSHQHNLLSLEYEQLQEDLDEREARITQLEDEKSRHDEAMNQLQDKLTETEHELDKVVSSFKQVREQLVDLQGQYDELALQELAYKDEIDDLHRKIKQYDDTRRLQQTEVSDLRRRLADTQEKYASLESRNAKLEEEYNQAKDVMNQVRQMEEGLNNLEQVLTKTERRNAELNDELEQEKLAHRELIKQLSADQEEITRKLEAAYTDENRHRQQVEDLQKQTRESLDEIARLTREIRQWERRYDELNEAYHRDALEWKRKAEYEAAQSGDIRQAHAQEVADLKAKHAAELLIQADKHARERQKADDEIRNLKAEADRALALQAHYEQELQEVQAKCDRDWEEKWNVSMAEIVQTHELRLQEVEQYLHAEYGRKHQEKVKLIKDVHQLNMEAMRDRMLQAEKKAERIKEDFEQYKKLLKYHD